MKRRSFLGSLLALTAAETVGGLFAPPGWIFRPAHAFSGRSILVVFQRGACDGLNVTVPYGDDTYYRLRPAIAIPPPGGGDFPAIDIDGFFGFHPALSGIAELYSEGQVAVLPAVQYANASRSHFESQDLIEHTGVADGSGWMNRYLASIGGGLNGLAGLGLGGSVPNALRGPMPAGAITGLASTTLSQDPEEELRIREVLARHYRLMPNRIMDAERRVREGGAVGLENLTLIRSLHPEGYQSAPDALYPDTLFGGRLRDVAFLVKQSVGLEVASIDIGGWDTHYNQGNGDPEGRQATQLAELNAGLTALMTDLGPRSNEICVIVMTEFGRTAKQNGSGGTDHGNASTWFVIGGNVQGGIYLGPTGWPGLEPDQLRDGRDLMHTVDYRDILAEALLKHLGSKHVDAVVPGYSPAPLGILAS